MKVTTPSFFNYTWSKQWQLECNCDKSKYTLAEFSRVFEKLFSSSASIAGDSTVRSIRLRVHANNLINERRAGRQNNRCCTSPYPSLSRLISFSLTSILNIQMRAGFRSPVLRYVRLYVCYMYVCHDMSGMSGMSFVCFVCFMWASGRVRPVRCPWSCARRGEWTRVWFEIRFWALQHVATCCNIGLQWSAIRNHLHHFASF